MPGGAQESSPGRKSGVSYHKNTVVGQFGLAKLALLTEPSSFARLGRADSEMKHVKNKDFFDMFLRSAVAPDAGINSGEK